jgi:hypothetical protein
MNGAIDGVNLIGNPPPAAPCSFAVSPSALTFGLVMLGMSKTLPLDVQNISSSVCSIQAAFIDAASTPGFSTTTANMMVQPGAHVGLMVAYMPTTAGLAHGVLHIDTNDAVTPAIDVPLAAAAAGSGICVDPVMLPFGATAVGTAMPPTLTFRIYACGGSAVTVTGLDWTTPLAAFSLVSPPALPFTLQAGAEQRVTVRYAPTAASASDRAVVTVQSTDAFSPAINVTCTGSAFAPAQAPTYINTSHALYSYDPAMNTATMIGMFAPGLTASMTDIAIDRAGHMYGVSNDQKIWSINPSTAAITMLFMVPDMSPRGLTCLSDGSLVVAGAAVTIYDPTTGMQVRTLVPTGNYVTSGDIVGLPDGFLYWTVNDGMDNVVRIDPHSGAMTALPPLGVNKIFGLGYAAGNFLGFSAYGNVIIIDAMTGAVTQNQMLNPGGWDGAATNPVLW